MNSFKMRAHKKWFVIFYDFNSQLVRKGHDFGRVLTSKLEGKVVNFICVN